MGEFFRNPLACLTLASYVATNAGDVARKHIKDPELLKFIDAECFIWSTVSADLTPMINAGMVFCDRHFGGINYPKGGVGLIGELMAAGARARAFVLVCVCVYGGGGGVAVSFARARRVRALFVCCPLTNLPFTQSTPPIGIEERGGIVLYKANVREILTEPCEGSDGSGSGSGGSGGKGEPKRRAVGVRLADGRVFKAKAVVSNATRWDTFEGLVGEAHLPESERLFRCGPGSVWGLFSGGVRVAAQAVE
jgi:prolycopene isomerase